MAKEQREVAQNIHQKYLINYLHQEVSYFLSQKENCQRSFAGTSTGKVAKLGLRSSFPSSSLSTSYNDQYYFVPYNQVDEKQVVYYETPIFVKSYELQEVETAQNQMELIVTYGQRFDLERKKILLNVERNPDKTLRNCFPVGFNKSIKKSNSSWSLRENSISTSVENVHIGSGLTGEGVVLKKGMLLVSENMESQCNLENEGLLIRKNNEGYYFCKDNIWQPLGNQELQTKHFISYQLGLSQIGSKKLVTAKHRHCFISYLKKDLNTDGCKVRRLSNDVFSPFEIEAFTSEKATGMECEVFCAN